MHNVLIIALLVLYIVSFVETSNAIDNSPLTKEGRVQITTVRGSIFAFLWTSSFILLIFLLRSWALILMWGWFVTPTLGFPVPNRVDVYGLCLFSLLFRPTTRATSSKTKIEYLQTHMIPTFTVLSLLAMGWLVKEFGVYLLAP